VQFKGVEYDKRSIEDYKKVPTAFVLPATAVFEFWFADVSGAFDASRRSISRAPFHSSCKMATRFNSGELISLPYGTHLSSLCFYSQRDALAIKPEEWGKLLYGTTILYTTAIVSNTFACMFVNLVRTFISIETLAVVDMLAIFFQVNLVPTGHKRGWLRRVIAKCSILLDYCNRADASGHQNDKV
jgi:hypothetical protein